jgi:hypothetical protein
MVFIAIKEYIPGGGLLFILAFCTSLESFEAQRINLTSVLKFCFIYECMKIQIG